MSLNKFVSILLLQNGVDFSQEFPRGRNVRYTLHCG